MHLIVDNHPGGAEVNGVYRLIVTYDLLAWIVRWAFRITHHHLHHRRYLFVDHHALFNRKSSIEKQNI